MPGRSVDADAEMAQRLFPLADMRGPLAYLKDGTMVGYIECPMRGESLDTVAQRMASAYADSDALGTIQQPYSLLLLPEKTNTTRQIVMIDAAARREREAIFHAKDAQEAEVHTKRLRHLTGWMREVAAGDAGRIGQVERRAYLAVRFDAGYGHEEAVEALSAIARGMSADASAPARLLDETGQRHLWSLYFKPNTPTDIGSTTGPRLAPLPDLGPYRR
jgi:hypothetical protein